MKKLNKLFAILFAVLGVQTLSAQTDVTSTYLTNADLSSLDGWTCTEYTDYKTDGDANVIEFYHTWGAQAGAYIGNSKNFYLKQTVTLPAGEYRLAVNAFYREGNGNGTNTKAYIFAGEQQQFIVGLSSGALSSYSGSNDLYKAANAFSKGVFSNEFDFTVEQETTMEIGFNGYIDTYCSWCILGPVRLLQYSMDDFNNELNAARTKLQGVTGLNTAMAAKVETVLSETENVTQTKADILEAIAKVNAMYDEVVEFSMTYLSINNLVELCETYAEESYSNVATEDVRTTFTTAIATAETAADNTTNVSDLNTAYNDLENARREFISVAYPTTGNSFDVTYKILNAEVVSKDNWTTNANLATNVDYTGAPDIYALDRWDGGSTNGTTVYAKQTINNLADGVYTLTAMARGNGKDMYYVYANSNDIEYKEVVIGGGETGNPWGLVTVSNIVVVNGGSMELGLKGTNNNTWFSVDNFKLYRSYDATTAQNTVTSLVAEANSLTGEVMNADIADALTEAINSADVTSDDPFELGNMASALNTAIANAEASIAAYETIATYIAKANKIDESIAAEYQTAYGNRTLESAETVFQELEVATYNYVMTNFTYPVALSDTWNSTGTNTAAGTFSNEHWSGEEREYKNQQDGDNWGWGASSWSIDFDQDVTLPAGKYVFKVAGRKSAGTTLELVVTMGETELGTVNDFPSSNNTIGINKAGAASFDPEDPAGFANNGAGYGWQWRYVKFTLDAEATVKVAVHAETNAAHNWVSFGDYTLQMTEETYLKANMGALDAPTAEANALVDTKPMGTEENTALKDALAMRVTTGAELLAKIEALETAVANANTWRNTYYTEKGKLVAALERFEADYNDAENGALDYMNKERWATAIEKAQAAAVAKDDLTSHAGLTTATTELTAALDAATVSVGEYAGLKAAIAEANAYYNGGNWGDQPFQRPTSVKKTLNTTTAQATYDAAEADGEGVTSVAEALNNAMDAIVLNAPKEGTCYKIVMGDLTWTNNNNADMLAIKDKSLVFVKGGQSEAQGLYSMNFVGKNDNYAHALTFNAVQDKTNQYTISFVDNDGATRYICDGSVTNAGTGVYGIRTTTDAAKALPVKVIATATDGVWNLYNTVANELLGAQDAGFYTVTKNNNLKIMEASKHKVALNISEIGWATLILPFDAELPEGVKAYSCTEANGEVLTLTEATSLEANTPYLMNGEKSEHAFTGYGLATKDNYTADLFVGTYVDYQTTADGKTYVLQNNNGNLAFYLVQDAAQPWVRANRCYMSYEAANGAPMFSFDRGEGTTGIENSELNIQDSAVVYDLMGRKVNTMVKGGMYIVNGKKVVIR